MSQNIVNTNNCPRNIDYSALAPTDTLNISIVPTVAGALATSTATAISGLDAGATSLATGLTGAVATYS